VNQQIKKGQEQKAETLPENRMSLLRKLGGAKEKTKKEGKGSRKNGGHEGDPPD